MPPRSALTAGPIKRALQIDFTELGLLVSLWGRAEGVRMMLRALAQAAAPLLFGLISDQLSVPGKRTAQRTGLSQQAQSGGLRDTFVVMLVPLAASGLILLVARHGYKRDVATALASQEAAEPQTNRARP